MYVYQQKTRTVVSIPIQSLKQKTTNFNCEKILTIGTAGAKVGEIPPGGEIQEEVAATSQARGVHHGDLIEKSWNHPEIPRVFFRPRRAKRACLMFFVSFKIMLDSGKSTEHLVQILQESDLDSFFGLKMMGFKGDIISQLVQHSRTCSIACIARCFGSWNFMESFLLDLAWDCPQGFPPVYLVGGFNPSEKY